MADVTAATAPDSAQPGGSLRRQLVEKEILDRASALFAERGIAGTSFKDLADALGMSRPALYYYFSGKDAVLESLVENLSGRDARALQTIRRRSGAKPNDKLREMARQVATNAGSNPQQSRILNQNRHQLPAGLAEAVHNAERSIVRDIVLVIEEGIAAGEFRRVDPHAAAMAVIGMCVWTAWWVRPETESTALEAIAEQIADQATASLMAAEPRGDRATPEALLRVLREDLEQLATVIADR